MKFPTQFQLWRKERRQVRLEKSLRENTVALDRLRQSLKRQRTSNHALCSVCDDEKKIWTRLHGVMAIVNCPACVLRLCLLCVFAFNCSAATYYIDYSTGADSNNGLSTGAPWKTHPYMANTAVSYAHNPGDQFIFKGGVAWPNACFPLAITHGGTGSGVTDYYGTNKTWFSGASYTSPIFNAGGSPITGGAFNTFVFCEDNNIIIDGILFTNFYWNSSSQGFGMSQILVYQSTNVQILNAQFLGWSHDTLANGCMDYMAVLEGGTTVLNPGCICSNCIFDGLATGATSGGNGAGYCFPVFENCLVRNMSDAIQPNGNGIVSGCVISNISASFDGVTHGAAIEPVGTWVSMDFHANLIRLSAQLNIFLRPAMGVSGNIYIYDNIIYDTIPGAILLSALNSGSCPAFIWNNTCDTTTGGSYGVLVEDGVWANLTDQNNMFITGTVTTGSGGSITTHVEDHNLFWSSATATANGYTAANLYRPTGPSSPTVGAGTNLSATFAALGLTYTDFGGVARINDIGAYQYPGGGGPVSGLNISGGGAINITSGGNLNITH